LYTTFKRNTPGRELIDSLKKDSASMQKLYIPQLVQALAQVDPQNTKLFVNRMNQFRPRLVMNMIDDPKDADKAQKIRRSCSEYLGIDLEHLGVIYKDSMQDIALSSRLPITVYKPQAMVSQAIFRIADKILQSETLSFDNGFDSFQNAENEAAEDFESKLSYVEDLLGSGALTMNDLAETIKSQQYEITQLRKENNLYKSKLLKAVQQGFKI
jgi:flagellar biosynthesis protein FlhG